MNPIRNVFDFDGVVTLGLRPGPNDLIVTGRPIDQFHDVMAILVKLGAVSATPIYFNTTEFDKRGIEGSIECRLNSALHKSRIIVQLVLGGVSVGNVFEDDPLQFDTIVSELCSHQDETVRDVANRLIKITHNGKY